MKIYQIKKEVYQLTSTKSTRQLKFDRPELVEGKDLRLKESWLSIYNTFKLLDNFHQEQTEKTISEQYGFKVLNATSKFEDLLGNTQSFGIFYQDLENKIDNLEFKINNNYEKNEF